MARRITFDDPQVLTYVRIAYVATQITVLGVYYYVGTVVRVLSLSDFACVLLWRSLRAEKEVENVC